MTTLALDFGARFGWACLDDGIISSGVWKLKGKTVGARLIDLHRLLTELGHVDRIVYEDVRRHLGVDAAHAYGAYHGLVSMWAAPQGIAMEGIGVKVVKKHATGNGNADKVAMMRAADARGWRYTDDNECDALWFLDYATGGTPAPVPVKPAKTKRARRVGSGDAPVSAAPDHADSASGEPGGRQGVDDRQPGPAG